MANRVKYITGLLDYYCKISEFEYLHFPTFDRVWVRVIESPVMYKTDSRN